MGAYSDIERGLCPMERGKTTVEEEELRAYGEMLSTEDTPM